ncbi:hypothetical protein MTR_1g012290 [Medicago truncatula]|uniref:Uncharacterized protein n=1 Tax=Medicago truncatula TaxID=3880 RepID=G7I6Y6_MEDTR|nr:hypothetical protein MTR_1g012290 [Medicago truncatula]
MAISIIDQFIAKCGPKLMLFILCYTLGHASNLRRPALPLTLSLLYQGSQRVILQ